MSASVEFVRRLGKDGGYKITVGPSRLTVTGGTHAEAYGPVDIDRTQLETLLADIHAADAATPNENDIAAGN